MSQLSGLSVIGQGLFDESVSAQTTPGSLALDKFGNKFRYAKNGAVALATGALLQEPAEDANFRSMVVQAAAAAGDSAISVTLGGTAVTAAQFEGGILVVESATGLGQQFRILSHTVQSSTTGTCTFTVDRPLKIALTTGSQVSVRPNPYSGVIAYPATTQTGGAVGVSLLAVQANYYTWIQSGGDCAVLFDTGTNTSNGVTAVGPSAAVAASVAPVLDAVGAIVLGFAREVVSVDSTFGIVHLQID